MMKSEFQFDEELVRKIAKDIATHRVDEELTHHPELVSQKEQMLQVKEIEVEKEIHTAVIEVVEDLTTAGSYLLGWFETLPPEKKEQLKKEFKRASEIFQSEWFQNQLKSSLENPLEKGSPLQKLLKLSNETLQIVYEAGCHLQREGDFQTGRAVFRFLAFLNPQVADFWLCLGFCFSSLRNYSEAFNAYRFASELSPNEPHGLYFAAVNFTLQHDFSKASEYCDECLNLINGHEALQGWKVNILELKEFISKKGALHD